MSDAWFNEKIAPDGVTEDGCHPDEAQALKDYYHKTTNANEAAQAITQPIKDSKDPGANLWRLWSLLTDALVELPTTQTPALIHLLAAIQHLPEPDLTGHLTENTPADGHLWRLWSLLTNALVELPTTQTPAPIHLLAAIQHLPEPDLTGRLTENTPADGHLWRNLPGFGHMWADLHKRDDWRDTLASSDPANRARLRTLHVKKAGIEARLAVADVGGFPLDWGYDCIADALERRDAVLDFEIPAAAEWIAIAGKRLYAGAVAGEESWALERRRDCGMGGRAMSLQRWAGWEKRLEEVAEREEAMRGVVEGAVGEMRGLMGASEGEE